MIIRLKNGTTKEIIYNEKQLYNYGLNRLNTREFSRQELLTKMKNLQPDLDIVNKVLDLLESKDYLSDIRRAKSIFSQYQHKESINKIKQRLFLKGVKKDVVEDLIENLNEHNPTNVAIKLLIKKFKIYDSTVYDKMVRHLASKGYQYTDISKAIKLFKEGEEDDE